MLSFDIHTEYKRSDIHDNYGGNRQSGISPSTQSNCIFIFSGSSGEQYGYFDEWLTDDVYQYTGAGQTGNMVFKLGNSALRDHKQNNKKVYLFEQSKKSHVYYKGELELFDLDYFYGKDITGATRKAIKFFFKRVNSSIIYPLNSDPVTATVNDSSNFIPNKTERTGLITSRVGQGAYRKGLIYRWNNQCAVSGYDHTGLLIASHIVPWKDSNDSERLDTNNGLLLSPNYDALFDKKLISFGDEGEILLTPTFENTNYQKLNITGDEKINKLNDKNYEYLRRHRISCNL